MTGDDVDCSLVTVRGCFADLVHDPEGGCWLVTDDRAEHGPVEVCPWDPGKPCAGTAAFWEEYGQVPAKRAHAHPDGRWRLRDGMRLTVYDRDGSVLLDRWTVALIEEPTPSPIPLFETYRSRPVGIEFPWFAIMGLRGLPALLEVPASEEALAQDARCTTLLEQRLAANEEIQAALREARAHPERRVPRPDNTAAREALRGDQSGESPGEFPQ